MPTHLCKYYCYGCLFAAYRSSKIQSRSHSNISPAGALQRMVSVDKIIMSMRVVELLRVCLVIDTQCKNMYEAAGCVKKGSFQVHIFVS